MRRTLRWLVLVAALVCAVGIPVAAAVGQEVPAGDSLRTMYVEVDNGSTDRVYVVAACAGAPAWELGGILPSSAGFFRRAGPGRVCLRFHRRHIEGEAAGVRSDGRGFWPAVPRDDPAASDQRSTR